MKIAVLIMSTNSEPSVSNVSAMEKTFIKYAADGNVKNEYTFVEYVADESDEDYEQVPKVKYEIKNKDLNMFKATVSCKESIYRTFEKTFAVFSSINDALGEFDLYIRINISNFINMAVLDSVVDKVDGDKIYSNAFNAIVNYESECVNTIYPRGDFMMFGKDIMLSILKNSADDLFSDMRLDTKRSKYAHVDDVIIGVAISKAFGREYVDKYVSIGYNLMSDHENTSFDVNMNYINSRVKTCPPGVFYTGYSWDDNEYRRFDSEKMLALQKKIDLMPIRNQDVPIEKILPKVEREILFVYPIGLKLTDVLKDIHNSRK